MTKVAYEDVTAGDADVYVDLTVEGAPEDVVEKVAIHARNEAVKALQAFDTGKPPEECEGTGVGIAWERVLEDDGGEDV